jgi:two-component system chemotaxis response regulator CheY
MKKVIVIDDSRTARMQVVNALASGGYALIEAVDGRDGLEKVRANPDAKVVICDVNMPNMSGIELLEAVKDDPALASIPVLMLTTEGQPELVKEASRKGAKGWLLKPCRADLLASAVAKLTAA